MASAVEQFASNFNLQNIGKAEELKARLWFTHRGIESLFEGLDALDAVHLAERISGDTAAAHGLAHSLAVEDALGLTLPDEAHRLRALLVELERIVNHVADIGALAVTCLSGSLVPLPILPHWVAHVAPWTPGYWALRGFQAAVESGGEQATTFGRSLGVLIGISILAFAVAAAGVRPRRSPALRRLRVRRRS